MADTPKEIGKLYSGSAVTPVPDPTVLTTAALSTAITALREVIETRLGAMDKAIELLQASHDRLPGRIDEKVERLREVHDEKFFGILNQFRERDVRVEQTARDTKVAVDAALQAAEKAVGKQNEAFGLSIAKSEAATVKQIDQQGLLIQTATRSLDDKINDIKERLTRIEGKREGHEKTIETRQTASSHWVAIVGLVIGSLIGVVGIVIAIIMRKP